MSKLHLRPCPFCGDKNVSIVKVENVVELNQTHVIVQCKNCFAYAGFPFTTAEWAKSCNYKEESADRWNRRSQA